MIVVWAMLVYLAQSIAGFLLTHLIWDAREPKVLIFKFFLGVGMGAGISSLLYFWWSWLSLPIGIYPFFEAATLVALIVSVWRKESVQNWQNLTFNFAAIQKKTVIWGTLLVASVSFGIANLWLRAMALPHGFYDAWAIWNMAARFLYGRSSGWPQLFSQAAWDHSDYPLLAPLNVAAGWLLTGSTSSRVPLALAMFAALGLTGLIFSALLIARDFEQGALAAILFSSLPTLALLGSFQYAEEILLSFFILATGALLYLYTVNSNPRLLILAGLCAGFAGWTKNEGQMFIVLSLLVCLVMSFNEKKNLFKYYLVGLLLPAITLLTFKSVTPPNDLFVDIGQSLQQLFDLSRYQLIFSKLAEQFGVFGYWRVSFFVVLLLYAFLVWVKPANANAKRWVPLLLFLLQSIGYYIIYLFTPRDLAWHLDTSLERLIFQVLPLMIFWLFIVLRSPADIFTKHNRETTQHAAHD